MPDLIWTLSCGRVPEIGGLGKEQATNIFDQSSCLTTKVRYQQRLSSPHLKEVCTHRRERVVHGNLDTAFWLVPRNEPVQFVGLACRSGPRCL